MSGATRIEWATKSWSPTKGCSPVSPGCAFCWARRDAQRLSCNLVIKSETREAWGAVKGWDGTVRFVESQLDAPLKWRKPERVATCLHGDLFHENVPDEWIDRVFGVMLHRLCQQHTFIVLTKRPKRMREFVAAQRFSVRNGFSPRIWLGISAENQEWFDKRIGDLIETPAAVRVVSLEPLLGPVDIKPWLTGWTARGRALPKPLSAALGVLPDINSLDHVIVGPETGPARRYCDPAWIRRIVKQCKNAGVPVFVKAVTLDDGTLLKDNADPRWPTWAVRQLPNGGKP